MNQKPGASEAAPASVFHLFRWWQEDPVKASLILGLAFLSWLATYTGILELIKANTGQLTLGVQVAIAFAVAMLMLMILYLLDSLFSPDTPKLLKPIFVLGYIFLTLISVGFGFGFYWKYLEARAEATRSAEAAISQVQNALQLGQTRLEQLQTTLAALTTISRQKAEQERTQGGTCPNSPPGDGPRRRLRDQDAESFKFAGDFVSQRAAAVKADLKALNADLAKVIQGDPSTIDPKTGTRNAFLRSLNRKLNLVTTRFNALRTDPQLRQFRSDFEARARKTVFETGRGGTFRCPDPQLQAALRGVVKAIDGLPEIPSTTIATTEGSEAIVEAFRRLATTIMALPTLRLPPTPEALRKMRVKAVQSAKKPDKSLMALKPGLGQRDYIPLFVAIFVDLCILLISLNRQVNRLQVVNSRIREAREGRFHEILTHLQEYQGFEPGDGIDLLHEIVFDSHGDYFAAVPLARDTETRFLANLFVSLEGIGIVDRVVYGRNFFTRLTKRHDKVRERLKRQNSRFADVESFRIYRFRKDILANVMLDAILGAARQVRAIERHRAERQKKELEENRKMLESLTLRLAKHKPKAPTKPERREPVFDVPAPSADTRSEVAPSLTTEAAADAKPSGSQGDFTGNVFPLNPKKTDHLGHRDETVSVTAGRLDRERDPNFDFLDKGPFGRIPNAGKDKDIGHDGQKMPGAPAASPSQEVVSPESLGTDSQGASSSVGDVATEAPPKTAAASPASGEHPKIYRVSQDISQTIEPGSSPPRQRQVVAKVIRLLQGGVADDPSATSTGHTPRRAPSHNAQSLTAQEVETAQPDGTRPSDSASATPKPTPAEGSPQKDDGTQKPLSGDGSDEASSGEDKNPALSERMTHEDMAGETGSPTAQIPMVGRIGGAADEIFRRETEETAGAHTPSAPVPPTPQGQPEEAVQTASPSALGASNHIGSPLPATPHAAPLRRSGGGLGTRLAQVAPDPAFETVRVSAQAPAHPVSPSNSMPQVNIQVNVHGAETGAGKDEGPTHLPSETPLSPGTARVAEARTGAHAIPPEPEDPILDEVSDPAAETILVGPLPPGVAPKIRYAEDDTEMENPLIEEIQARNLARRLAPEKRDEDT